MTVNAVGKGQVYYIGGYCDVEAVAALVRNILSVLKIEPVIDAGPEVEAVERASGGRRFISLCNHSGEDQSVRIPRGTNLLDGTAIDGELTLPAHGVAIVALRV